MLGCCCPCILFGKTRARLDNPRMRKEQLPCCSGMCCGYATVMLFCAPFQCIFGWIMRGDIRAKYDIEGNGCVDCLAHTFCDCCVSFPVLLEVRGADLLGFDSGEQGGSDEGGCCNAWGCVWTVLCLIMIKELTPEM